MHSLVIRLTIGRQCKCYSFASFLLIRLSDHLPLPNSHPPLSPVAGGPIIESIARLQIYSTGTPKPGIPLYIFLQDQVDLLAGTEPYDPELRIEIVALATALWKQA
jgi:hypothetical protein